LAFILFHGMSASVSTEGKRLLNSTLNFALSHNRKMESEWMEPNGNRLRSSVAINNNDNFGQAVSYEVGQEVIAKWKEDDVWYRGSVKQVSSDSYFVHFLDYGNEDYVGLKDVCSLIGQIPHTDQIDVFVHQNYDKIQETECSNKVTKTDENQNMLKSGLLDKIEPTVAVSPYKIGQEDNENNNQGQAENITKQYTSNIKHDSNFKMNQRVFAKWCEDETWYRAKITHISNQGCDVIFEDYGNCDHVPFNNIKTDALTFPAQDKVDQNILKITQQKTCLKATNLEYGLQVLVLKDNVWCNAIIDEVNADHCKVYLSDLGFYHHVKFEEMRIDPECSSETVVNSNFAKTESVKNNFGAKSGEIVVVKWSEDCVWYNAVINEIKINSCIVTFTDYGNSAEENMCNIKKTSADIPKGEEVDEFVIVAKAEMEESKNISSTNEATINDVANVKSTKEAPGIPNADLQVGMKVVTKWTEDCVWYNSVIDEIKIDSCIVTFTDYGNSAEEKIYNIKKSSADIPTGEVVDEFVTTAGNEDAERTGGNGCVAVSKTTGEEANILNKIKQTNEIQNKDLQVGMKVVAKWSEDQVWYNAVIDKIEIDTCIVTFTDYGNKSCEKFGNIKMCPSKIGCTEAIDECVVMKTNLENNIQTIHQNSSSKFTVGMNVVAKWTQDNTWYNAIIDDITAETYHVTFKDYGNSAIVSYQDIKCTADELGCNDLIDQLVKITSTNDLLNGHESHLNLNEYGSTDGKAKVRVKIGMGVFVKWSEDDIWYNAVIDEIIGDACSVTFTDYGNSAIEDFERIKCNQDEIPGNENIDQFVKRKADQNNSSLQETESNEDDAAAQAIRKTEEELFHDMELKIPKDVYRVDTIVLARSRLDRKWYNARIDEINCDCIRVSFYDYPDRPKEKVGLEDVVLPYDDIPEEDGLDEHVHWVRSQITKCIQGGEGDVEIIDVEDKNAQEYKVRLQIGDKILARWSNVWCNATILRLSRKKFAVVHLTDLGKKVKIEAKDMLLRRDEIPDGDEIHPKLEDICCDEYLNRVADDKKVARDEKKAKFSLDQHVYAKGADDQVWYRGLITEICQGFSEYGVIFIDYGNTAILKVSDILISKNHIPPGDLIDENVDIHPDPSAVGILDVNPAPTLSSSIFSPQVNVSGSSINTSSQDEPSLPKLESQPSDAVNFDLDRSLGAIPKYSTGKSEGITAKQKYMAQNLASFPQGKREGSPSNLLSRALKGARMRSVEKPLRSATEESGTRRSQSTSPPDHPTSKPTCSNSSLMKIEDSPSITENSNVAAINPHTGKKERGVVMYGSGELGYTVYFVESKSSALLNVDQISSLDKSKPVDIIDQTLNNSVRGFHISEEEIDKNAANVYKTPEFEELWQIQKLKNPVGISGNQHSVYISCKTDNKVVDICPKSGHTFAEFPVPDYPQQVLALQDGGLAVSYRSGMKILNSNKNVTKEFLNNDVGKICALVQDRPDRILFVVTRTDVEGQDIQHVCVLNLTSLTIHPVFKLGRTKCFWMAYSRNYLYLSEEREQTILVYTLDGKFVSKMAPPRTDDCNSTEGQDKFLPHGLAVHHRTGIVMVVDRNSNDIQFFGPEFDHIGKVSLTPVTTTIPDWPCGLYLDTITDTAYICLYNTAVVKVVKFKF